MGGIEERIRRLERALGAPNAPVWEEFDAANFRLLTAARARLRRILEGRDPEAVEFFGEPQDGDEEFLRSYPTERRELDEQTVARYRAAHGIEPDPQAKERLIGLLNRAARHKAARGRQSREDLSG